MTSNSSSLLFRIHQNAAVSSAHPPAPPPSLSPNYSEVFGGHHGDGVPVLKSSIVDLLDIEKELPFDLGLVDYDQVFGGYDDWSFAPSYEEVFGKANTVQNEATCWTQLEAHLSHDNAYHSIQSTKRNLSSENHQEASDFNRRLSLSDQEENLVSSHFKETDGLGCVRRDSNYSKEMILDTEEEVKCIDVMSQNGLEFKGLQTISGISLRTDPSKRPPPSRQPPWLDVQNEDSKGLHTKSRGGRSRSYSFQGTVNSPIFDDVEVDGCSAASASAASMLDAMEKARAKLNYAKEIMERKKEGLPCHSKPSQKKFNNSNKSNENLVVAAESKKSFAGDGYKDFNSSSESVSESMKDTKDNSATYKLIMKKERQRSWSCGESVNKGAEAKLDMAEVDQRIRLADDKRPEPMSDVLKCDEDNEARRYEPCGKERVANRQPVGVCYTKEIVCERTNGELSDIKTLDGRKGINKQIVGADSCNENDFMIQGENRNMKIGFELNEVCVRVHDLRGASFPCDTEDSDLSIKEPYGLNVDIEVLGSVSRCQSSFPFTLSRDSRELEKPRLDDDNTKINGSQTKLKLSEDRFTNNMDKVVKPFNSLYNLKEKLDSKAEVVRGEGDIKMKPRLNSELESVNKKVLVTTPTLEEISRAAAATRNKVSQEIMIHSHSFGESNDFKDILTAKSSDEAILFNEVHVPISGGLTNDTQSVAVERDHVKPKVPQADSPLRRKARLERERRTAERAEKALAEKIMRDLAAQREQAERNKIANSLSSEVKRWATGKEGNLRALLSTLQYILGTDSGWKPIPLMDVITPVAVKKAYRKATLHVHPDKVQQRGDNIQQQFICEKIFDLLKDAWNKFNSEGL